MSQTFRQCFVYSCRVQVNLWAFSRMKVEDDKLKLGGRSFAGGVTSLSQRNPTDAFNLEVQQPVGGRRRSLFESSL